MAQVPAGSNLGPLETSVPTSPICETSEVVSQGPSPALLLSALLPCVWDTFLLPSPKCSCVCSWWN